MRLFLFTVLSVTSFIGFCQSKQIDSLQSLINKEADSERKVEILNQLSFAFFDSDVDKAGVSTQLALQLSQKIGDRHGEGWATAYRGVYFLFSGQLKNAQEYFTKSLKLSRRLQDHNLQAYSLNQLGNVNRDKGVFDSAYQFYQQAEQYLKQNPDPYYQSVVKVNLGRYYLIVNKPDSALLHINEALKLREPLNNQEAITDVWMLLGNCHRANSNLIEAERYNNMAIQFAQSKSAIHIQYLINMGEVQFSRGDFEGALTNWREALSYHRRLNYKYELALLLLRMGEAFEEQGLPTIALEYLTKSLAISKGASYQYLVGQTYHELAWVFWRSRELALAHENNKLAEILFAETKQKLGLKGIAGCWNLTGLIQMSKHNYDSSLYFHLKSLESSERIGNKTGMSASFFNIGELFLAKKEYGKALPYLRRGLKIDEGIGDNYGRSLYYHRIGTCFNFLGSYDSAKYYLEKSVSFAILRSATDILPSGYFELASYFKNIGKPNEAIDYYQRGIQIVDSLRGKEASQNLTSYYRTLYDLETKETAMSVLSKDNLLGKIELQQQKQIIYAILIGSFILTFFAIAFYLFNKRLKKLNHSILEKSEVILLKNEELLNLNVEKNNLIGIVAHDLKSPLNQIKGLVTIIKLTPSSINGEAVEYIQMIENSASRLTNMIGKILDVQAIDSKQLNITFEAVNFSEMVKSVAERFTNEAQRKKIQLHSSISDSVMVNVDRSYAEEVIENLLSNAIKFSPADKNIYINISTNDNTALFEIRDEGPGLSEEDKKKLFGKYQRLSATPTGNESSTGLGLSIVKKFVDAMKGEIWCESESGNGASFFVKFELAKLTT